MASWWIMLILLVLAIIVGMYFMNSSPNKMGGGFSSRLAIPIVFGSIMFIWIILVLSKGVGGQAGGKKLG